MSHAPKDRSHHVEWGAKPIGEFASVNYGYTAKASFEQVGPKFLRITDIQDGNVEWESVPFCPIDVKDHARHSLKDGDIVFARTGATTGKSFLLSDPPNAVAASYLIRLRLEDTKIMPEFVSLFFDTKEYWDAIGLGISGSAQGGFNASKLSELAIPVPPLAEQERIVAILDEAFEGIATATAHAERNLHNARELFQSVLQSTFEQPGEDWVEKRVGEVCNFQSGGTPSKQHEPYWNGNIPWVSGKDMKSDKISDSILHVSQSAVDDNKTRRAPKGAVLILVRGMGLANGVRPAELLAPCTFNQDIKAMLPNESVSPRFLTRSLSYSLNAGDGILNSAAHGTLKINLDDLKAARMRLPPLKTQQQIVQKLDALAAETRRLEAVYERKLAALAELKQSLLQRAFAGEL